MTAIAQFESLKKQAESVKATIASMRGAREEVIKSIKALGFDPENLEAELLKYQTAKTELEAKITEAVDALAKSIAEANAAIEKANAM